MGSLIWIVVVLASVGVLLTIGLPMLGLLLAAALLPLIFVLILLYLLVFLRPRGRKPADERLLRPYAHRGLHGDGVPENSLEAFRLACEAGYGIELDVQTARDGTVVVFHDYNLSRMTGKDALLSELDFSELKSLHLCGTQESIPTLREVLDLVDGRVPILVELKGESMDTSLCAPVAEILNTYHGPFCVESFNPLLVWKMGKYIPDVWRGLLYTNVFRGKNEHPFVNLLLVCMALNFLAKPDFIAFNQQDRRSPVVWLSTRLFRAAPFVWTVQTPEEAQIAEKRGELPIFERIRP